MSNSAKKLEKLVRIAQLYYQEEKTQSEIAKIYGVSRPLVSRMLREAKELGIVEIRIRPPRERDSQVLSRAKAAFGIQGGALVGDSANDNMVNRELAEAAIHYLCELEGAHFGIGWGTVIGEFITALEEKSPRQSTLKTVCPLVGNSGICNRNYHPNENVRIFAQQTFAEPYYLHTPAFAESQQDMELIHQMEHYKAVYHQWEQLDVALVNIGNYPSVPDFAAAARYGEMLSTRRPAGRLLAYFYDDEGKILRSDTDYAIQIPTGVLARCPNVIGICSANVTPRTLLGALRTGLITHLIAREWLVQEALERCGGPI